MRRKPRTEAANRRHGGRVWGAFALIVGMRRDEGTHHRLAHLAERQHGVVSREQMRKLGYSDSAVDRATRAGRLHRIHRGVYAVGHVRLSPHGHCHAALLACGRRAMLSHDSAAWLWGLQATLASTVDVAIPARGHHKRGIRVHYLPRLVAEDIATSEGLPTTSASRTLLDRATSATHKAVERDLDRAERLGLLELAAIDELLMRAGKHPGIAKLRAGAELHRDPAYTRSWLERRFLQLVRKSGLPIPSTNVFIAGFELDMYWERERFAVELDGYAFHSSRKSFESDRRRQEELKLAGIEMVRFTAQRVIDGPREVAGRLSRLLTNRQLELSRLPDRSLDR